MTPPVRKEGSPQKKKQGMKPSGSILTRDFIRGIYESLEIDVPTDEGLDTMVADMDKLAQDATATPAPSTVDAFNKLRNTARTVESSQPGN
jgi:hypothetical protein